jgi:hypothetical protein
MRLIVEVPDMATGFEMFARGELDGLANIGIVLRAMVEKSPLKSKVTLLPRTEELSYESMACSLPQNDSEMARLRERGTLPTSWRASTSTGAAISRSTTNGSDHAGSSISRSTLRRRPEAVRVDHLAEVGSSR